MNRRGLLSSLGLGALAGCLRLESDGAGSETETTAVPSTRTTRATTTSSTTEPESTGDSTGASVDGIELSQVWSRDVQTRKLELVDDTLYLGSWGALHGLDPASGATDWTLDPAGSGSIDRFAVTPTELFATVSADDHEQALFAAFDRESRTETWTARGEYGNSFDDPSPDGDYVAVTTGAVDANPDSEGVQNRGSVSLLDRRTGDRVWAPTGYGGDEGTVSGAALGHDSLFVLGDDVVAYDVQSRRTRWRFEDTVPVKPPLLAEGTLFVPNIGDVQAVSPKQGSVVWATETHGQPTVQPLLVDGSLVVRTQDVVEVFDAASGDRRWFRPTTGAGYAPPVVVAGVVFTFDRYGTAYANELAGGSDLLEDQLAEESVTATAVDKRRNRLFVGTNRRVTAYQVDVTT